MRRSRLFAASLTAAFLTAASSSHGQQTTVATAPAITFTGNANWAPYQFINDEGNPDGFSVDLAGGLCRELKLRRNIKLSQGWEEAQRAVVEGTADAVLGFEKTPWREGEFDFSRPIAKLTCVVAVCGESTRVHSVRDLYGTSVAVVSETPVYDELRADARYNIVPVRGELEGLRKLVARQVKAMVGDELSIRYAVQRYRMEGVRIVGRPVFEMDYVIAVRKGNTQLLEKLDAGLDALERRGAIDTLTTKWFGSEIRVETLPPWVKWAAAVSLAVISLVGLAVILLLVFNEKLQEQVKSRTLELEQANEELKQKIEERARTNEELGRSEARYRTLVEQIPAVTYIAALDAQSTTLFVSPQIKELIGFSPEEYTADRDIWAKRLHPDDRDRVLAEVARSHATGGPFVSEYRMIARDGRVVWFHDSARIIRDSNGTPLFLQGVMYDITDQKR
jgi:PAS domain S-box-containing protein